MLYGQVAWRWSIPNLSGVGRESNLVRGGEPEPYKWGERFRRTLASPIYRGGGPVASIGDAAPYGIVLTPYRTGCGFSRISPLYNSPVHVVK